MVSTPVETTVIPASTSGSSLAVVPPHSMNPSPFPGEASPSPLTTAAPTPATLNSPTPVIGTAAGVAEDGSNRPASVNSQYTADSMRARGDTSVAGDSLAASSKGQSSTLAGASFASQRASPAVEGSAVASSIQVGTKVETGQQGFRSGVASVADDRNIFELSDSYNDAPHQHLMGAVNAQTSSVQVMQTLAVPAAAPANSVRSEPAAAPKPFEPPRLFSNSNMENSNSYMALDQLSQFNNDVPAAVTAPVVVEAPVPQSSYQRNARPSSAGPGSVSPSLSAASRYRDSDDAQEQPSEDTTSSSTRSRSARDPLDYVLGEAALPAPTKTAERGSKQSWIVPPKDLNRRSCSAPPGAFSGRPSTASTRGAEREHDSYQPPRRMSAATAAKVQQLKSLSPEERSRHRTVRPRHGVSASTAAPNAITSIRWHQREKQLQALVGERQNADAVQRLSQENWRLSRKFERLQHELADLRDSQQFLNESGIGALPPPPKPFLYKKSPGIGAVTSKHELGDKDGVRAEKPPKQPRASVFDVSGFSTRDSDAVAITAPAAKPKKAAAKKGESSSAASHRNIHEPSSNNECDQQSPGSSDRPSGIPRLEKGGKASGGGSERLTGTRAAEGWEVHMEEALQRLKEENRKLLERVN